MAGEFTELVEDGFAGAGAEKVMSDSAILTCKGVRGATAYQFQFCAEGMLWGRSGWTTVEPSPSAVPAIPQALVERARHNAIDADVASKLRHSFRRPRCVLAGLRPQTTYFVRVVALTSRNVRRREAVSSELVFATGLAKDDERVQYEYEHGVLCAQRGQAATNARAAQKHADDQDAKASALEAEAATKHDELARTLRGMPEEVLALVEIVGDLTAKLDATHNAIIQRQEWLSSAARMREPDDALADVQSAYSRLEQCLRAVETAHAGCAAHEEWLATEHGRRWASERLAPDEAAAGDTAAETLREDQAKLDGIHAQQDELKALVDALRGRLGQVRAGRLPQGLDKAQLRQSILEAKEDLGRDGPSLTE